jgi:hypothetical protein
VEFEGIALIAFFASVELVSSIEHPYSYDYYISLHIVRPTSLGALQMGINKLNDITNMETPPNSDQYPSD